MNAESKQRQLTATTIGHAINGQRLIDTLQALAEFGALPGGGVNRQALTPQENKAREWLLRTCAQTPGYCVCMDESANVILRRMGVEPALAPVLTGSHVDTQPQGGWLDGAFGVVAGLEVMRTLDDANVRTRHSLDLVMWTNEEGSRFAPGLMGSTTFVHPERLADYLTVCDAQGMRLAEARDNALASFRQAASRYGWQCMQADTPSNVHAYVEAHIEQGPVLAEAGLQVGCVTAIQGVRWYRVIVSGRSAHAGTTPRGMRDDAQAKAIALAQKLMTYANNADDALRVTIGRWSCSPDSVNTIADQVMFTIDVRHPDPGQIDAFDHCLRAHLPFGAQVSVLQDKPTVHFDKGLVSLVRQACQTLSISHRDVVSGAFHDAMPMAEVCPTVMLFAPSIGGISHHPDEDTACADLVACTRALAWCLTMLSEPVLTTH